MKKLAMSLMGLAALAAWILLFLMSQLSSRVAEMKLVCTSTRSDVIEKANADVDNLRDEALREIKADYQNQMNGIRQIVTMRLEKMEKANKEAIKGLDDRLAKLDTVLDAIAIQIKNEKFRPRTGKEPTVGPP